MFYAFGNSRVRNGGFSFRTRTTFARFGLNGLTGTGSKVCCRPHSVRSSGKGGCRLGSRVSVSGCATFGCGGFGIQQTFLCRSCKCSTRRCWFRASLCNGLLTRSVCGSRCTQARCFGGFTSLSFGGHFGTATSRCRSCCAGVSGDGCSRSGTFRRACNGLCGVGGATTS